MEQYTPSPDQVLAHLRAKRPDVDFEVSDGRIWGWYGEGDGADWLQFAFLHECYFGKGGTIMYRGNEL